MRFHILGIPHTISTPEYSSCAFTQKVVKLCAMLKMEGHTVFHYGCEGSKVECDEHISVTTQVDLTRSYPGHSWRKSGWPQFTKTDPIYSIFYACAINEIKARACAGDFLLCSFGDFHKPVADALPELITVESGIGYPNGTFAKFKIYESYAIMHAYQGNAAAISASNEFWYDAVIPNAFNLKEFDYSKHKLEYFLFLGRVNEGKGIHIAKQIAEATNTKLVVAGPGMPPMSDLIEYRGVVNPRERRSLLRNAKAIICASTFLEPFCGVQIEAMLSGTPVISSDWGAFTEYNIHGETGYRCKTFEQFVWAAKNIRNIDPRTCHDYAEKFALQNVAPYYTDYFKSVSNVFGGKGWYEENPARIGLDTASFS